MRLWSIHPRYLDAKGLTALWREALLAQKVLQGRTRGYQHHPQLARFRAAREPLAAIAAYLWAVHDEAARRHYHFNAAKIARPRPRRRAKIPVRAGQMQYEFAHLLTKLKHRDPPRHRQYRRYTRPRPHPLFAQKPGGVEEWEVA